MSVPAWENHAPEEAHLFNPAFCGALIYEFVKAFAHASGGNGAPLPLIFCALPISLHLETRERLPSRTITSLPTWLQRHPDVLVGYAKRARNLTPYVRGAIRFAAARKALDFDDDGCLILGELRAPFVPRFLEESTREARDIVIATRMLGRWFAGAGETATILAVWGITV